MSLNTNNMNNQPQKKEEMTKNDETTNRNSQTTQQNYDKREVNTEHGNAPPLIWPGCKQSILRHRHHLLKVPHGMTPLELQLLPKPPNKRLGAFVDVVIASRNLPTPRRQITSPPGFPRMHPLVMWPGTCVCCRCHRDLIFIYPRKNGVLHGETLPHHLAHLGN